MYSPRGRTGRTASGMKPLIAAVAVALMGMGGVALADPKAEPGPPEQAQGNGPPPQAQTPVPAAAPAPAPAPSPPPKAQAKGLVKRAPSAPAEVPQAAPPPQAGGNANPGHHGRPAPGEKRGYGPKGPKPGKASGCQAARCHAPTPEPSSAGNGGADQPTLAGGEQGAEGDLPGAPGERPDHDRSGTGGGALGGGLDSGAVLGADQGGGEVEVSAERGSFDGALPFTGFELALMAGIGVLLALAGVRLRRWAA
jgi:hypothetical protein